MIFPLLTPPGAAAPSPSPQGGGTAPSEGAGAGFAALFLSLLGVAPEATQPVAAAPGPDHGTEAEADPSVEASPDGEGVSLAVPSGEDDPADGAAPRRESVSPRVAVADRESASPRVATASREGVSLPGAAASRGGATTAGWAVLVETTAGEIDPAHAETPPPVRLRRRLDPAPASAAPEGAVEAARTVAAEGGADAPAVEAAEPPVAVGPAGRTTATVADAGLHVSVRPTARPTASVADAGLPGPVHPAAPPTVFAAPAQEVPASTAATPGAEAREAVTTLPSAEPVPATRTPRGEDRASATVGAPVPAARRTVPDDDAPTAPAPEVGETASSTPAAHAPSQVVPAAPAPPPTDVRTPDRSRERLHPELRGRVERVIRRMADEHGTRVEMVEGYRSAERQGWLWAQGRSRPGPVVTWTRASLHQEGRAADLKVEGPWSGQPTAYAHLQRIAREEGLDTLGMRDPGHVQLPDEVAPSVRGGVALASADEGATPREAALPPSASRWTPAEGAPLSGVARVARVARVAPVAETARVALPQSVVAARPSGPGPLRSGPASAEGSGEGHDLRAPDGPREPREVPAPPVVRVAAEGQPAPAVREIAGADPLDGMARVDRVAQLREALSGIEPQRASIRLDGTAGPVERVQVELLDRVLRGQVEVDDAGLAGRLRRDVGEVLRTLGEQGYDARELAVKLAASTGEGARDGMGGWLRSEGAAQALRTVLGAQPDSSPGRDPHEGHGGEPRRGAPDQNPNPQHSRRENRRESR